MRDTPDVGVQAEVLPGGQSMIQSVKLGTISDVLSDLGHVSEDTESSNQYRNDANILLPEQN